MSSSQLSPVVFSSVGISESSSALSTFSSSASSDESIAISTAGIIDFKVVKKISIFSFVKGKSGTTSKIPSKNKSISSSSSFLSNAAKATVFKDKISSCLIQFILTPLRSNLHGTYKSGVKNSLRFLDLPLRPTKNIYPYIKYLSFELKSLCIISSVKLGFEPSSFKYSRPCVKSVSESFKNIHLLSLSPFKFLKVELLTSSLTQS